MHLKLLQSHHKHYVNPTYSKFHLSISCIQLNFPRLKEIPELILKCRKQMAMSLPSSSLVADAPIRFKPISASLDLTEENINLVLADAKVELGQLFDTSVGITGKAELADLDGPYVKIRLSGKFWHERSVVLARLGNYLKKRIPEILEVHVEDEKQLDDSPENF
ncbi:hypothetical protein M9H77_21470 [Catharanthus roseus]|uniref:Uncharacterized protein n=1 Tax=Catharanthus roseus TaxID=4058 RepID=A0ACC0AQ78_CATRO|nr:hypothetical protein M9H77_21470 [Catharanthus roseus]